jgi:hypothetical protein
MFDDAELRSVERTADGSSVVDGGIVDDQDLVRRPGLPEDALDRVTDDGGAVARRDANGHALVQVAETRPVAT